MNSPDFESDLSAKQMNKIATVDPELNPEHGVI
jgi:hypothetical protein